MTKDPYEVLNIPHGASVEEAAKAYRRLAKKYHPDLNPDDPVAAEKMAEINAAFDAIKNGTAGSWYEESRTSYDGGTYRGYQQSWGSYGGMDAMAMAELYVHLGAYPQAINTLENMQNRSARWYYLSAVARHNVGDRVTAMDYARRAVSMEPENSEYQDLLAQMERGGRIYRQDASEYGRQLRRMNFCMSGLCFGQMLIPLCCMRPF